MKEISLNVAGFQVEGQPSNVLQVRLRITDRATRHSPWKSISIFWGMTQDDKVLGLHANEIHDIIDEPRYTMPPSLAEILREVRKAIHIQPTLKR